MIKQEKENLLTFIEKTLKESNLSKSQYPVVEITNIVKEYNEQLDSIEAQYLHDLAHISVWAKNALADAEKYAKNRLESLGESYYIPHGTTYYGDNASTLYKANVESYTISYGGETPEQECNRLIQQAQEMLEGEEKKIESKYLNNLAAAQSEACDAIQKEINFQALSIKMNALEKQIEEAGFSVEEFLTKGSWVLTGKVQPSQDTLSPLSSCSL
jgi:hypothetical protein